MFFQFILHPCIVWLVRYSGKTLWETIFVGSRNVCAKTKYRSSCRKRISPLLVHWTVGLFSGFTIAANFCKADPGFLSLCLSLFLFLLSLISSSSSLSLSLSLPLFPYVFFSYYTLNKKLKVEKLMQSR